MLLATSFTRLLLSRSRPHLSPALLSRSSSSSSNLPQKKVGEDSLIVDEQAPIKPVKQALLKRIRVEYHGIESSKFNDETLWIPIYRLPYLMTFSGFIRAKVYMTVLSAVICASNINMFFAGKTGASLFGTLVLSSLTLGGLLFIGDYFRRIICQIYVTEDLLNIRISRFTFFGKRRDIVLPVDYVIPLTETNKSSRAPLLVLHFNPTGKLDLNHDYEEFYDNNLRVSVLLGGVLDRDKFKKVLGNILDHKIGA